MENSDVFKSEEEPSSYSPSGGSTGFRLLVVVVCLLGLAVGYLAYAQYRGNRGVFAQLEQVSAKLDALALRTSTLEETQAGLQEEVQVTTDKLGRTQKRLAQTRVQARQLKEEQEQTASGLVEQQNLLGSITGEVTNVKDDVAETQETLEATRTQLERTIGDLGMQSGLIARNREELEELKRRGERDYFEFDLRKSKRYARVGELSIRLHKTDSNRNKYTMSLLMSDKRIEKKDKTLFEPVQFYLPGSRHLLEIVVFELEKNRVAGYLSVPKQVASTRQPT